VLSSQKKKNRVFTRIVIAVAILGIFYFGYRAISDVMSGKEENPFEYNIEYFKQSDTTLHHYVQSSQIEINMSQLYGLAIGPHDYLYVSGDHNIYIFDQNGSIHTKLECNAPVRTLYIDKNKDIFAAKSDHIEIYDNVGSQIARWDTLGQKALITSLTVGEEYVFVADAGNHIVWKFNRKGDLLGKIGEKDETRDIPGFIIPSPYFDLAIDPDGYLWVVNPGRHSLENYTNDGDLRSSWGNPSITMEGFCGCCNPTHIAFLNDGSFVTSEKGIARVKVYNRVGNLVSVVALPEQFIEGTEGLDLAVDSRNQIYVLDPKQKTIRIYRKKLQSNGERVL